MKNLNLRVTVLSLVALIAIQFTASKINAQSDVSKNTIVMKTKVENKKINLKQYILPGSTMFVSGLLDGTIEAIKFHYYSGFKPRFKNANDQFWDPDKSWTNKYKNGNPEEGAKFLGSTNSLVFVTDGYHALRTSKNLINTLTLTFYINSVRKDLRKVKLKKVLLDTLILTTIRNVGFTASYSLLFKTQKVK